MSRLAGADVAEIRRLAAAGLTQREIADRYGKSQGRIWQILHPEQDARLRDAKRDSRRRAREATGSWPSQTWRNASVENYLRNLLTKALGRKGGNLTHEELLAIWREQEGRCALTGAAMTWAHGTVLTNVSIDRIDHDGGYDASNVHLVCYAVNMMRRDMTVETFIEWARLVVERAEG